MASQEPVELRATEVRSDDVDAEVLSPATPGAETLGSPDVRSAVPADSQGGDDAVLAPATPGAEVLGVDEDAAGPPAQ